MRVNRRAMLVSIALASFAVAGPALAQKKYDPGASDIEIKVGNIMPYSGPASAYGTIGRAEAAYFRMINDQGGINGRRITFISYDDAYSPPQTVEQARKLVENDDYGKDVLKGLKDGLGNKTTMIIAEMPYETGDPTVDSQVVALKASGADIFVNIATPKFAAQAIKKVGELGWKPVHILNNVSSSIGSVLKPAGFENAKGILSTAYQKDPSDPGLKGDPGLKNWTAFMDKYFPEGNKADTGNVTAYITAKALVQVLRQCGNNLTRENVMRQAANLKDFEIDMLIDGIKVNTSPTDYFPVEELQMRRFNGAVWELFGPIMSGEIGS